MADLSGMFGDGQNGRMLGESALTQAIDKFDKAVDKLSNIYDKNVKPGVGYAQSLWTGQPQQTQKMGNGQNGGGSSFTINSYSAMNPGKQGEWLGPTSPYRKYLGQSGPLSGYGPSRGFPSSTFAAPKMPNAGGPNVPSNNNPGQAAPGSGNGGNPTIRGTAVKGAGLSATYKALANYGSSMLQRQLPMDQYVYQGSLGMTGNLANNQAALRRQAFGQNNQNLNAIAQNPTDAARMYSELGQVAGTPLLNSTQAGQTINRSASQVGVLNPYMSGQQNAMVQSNVYNPVTSLRSAQMGFMSPRTPGTGVPRDFASVTRDQLMQQYGGRMPTAKEINAGFGEGGKLRLASKYRGFSDQTIEAEKNIALIEAKVSAEGGNWNDAQKLIERARTGDTKAQDELEQKYGVPRSLAQSLKNKQAAKTGRDADTSASFNKALADATDTLQKFSKALTAFMNKTGITDVLGTGGAWASQLQGSLSGFSNLTSGVGGIVGAYAAGKMFSGGASKLLGGATTAETVAAGRAGLASRIGAAGAAGPTGIVAALAMPSIEKGKDTAINKSVQDYGKKRGIDTTQHQGESKTDYYKRMLQEDSRHSSDGQSGGDNEPQSKKAQAGPKPNGKQATGNASAAKVIQTAEKYLGMPYHFGGNNPKTSFDCSGLLQWSFKEAGMELPRTAKEQQQVGKAVPKNQVRAGDLIFKGNPATHVALMLDNKTLIEAPHTGASIHKKSYKPGEWTNAKRVLGVMGSLRDFNNKTSGDTNGQNEQVGNQGDYGDSNYGGGEEVTSLQDKLAGGANSGLSSGYGSPNAYETGTNNAASGFALVGERGPELVELTGGEKIKNNSALNKIMQANNDKPMKDLIIGGGLGSQSNGQGNVVNLNFGDGSIVIKQAKKDSAVVGTTSKQVRDDIKREDLYCAIASGKK